MDKGLLQAGAWIKGAYALVAADSLLWGGTTALYLLIAAIVLDLPFMGGVLLILFTPVVIAGVLREAAHPDVAGNSSKRIRDIFVGALRDRALALPVMSTGTILLGAWVFLTVLAMVGGIDGRSLGLIFAHRDLLGRVFTGLLLLIFWGLQVMLAVTVLYVLAAIVLGAARPMEALEHTLALWRERPLALTTLGATFVLPLIVAFYWGPWVRALVALVTLVPLTLAVSLSYRAFKATDRRYDAPLVRKGW